MVATLDRPEALNVFPALHKVLYMQVRCTTHPTPLFLIMVSHLARKDVPSRAVLSFQYQ